MCIDGIGEVFGAWDCIDGDGSYIHTAHWHVYGIKTFSNNHDS